MFLPKYHRIMTFSLRRSFHGPSRIGLQDQSTTSSSKIYSETSQRLFFTTCASILYS